MKTYGKLQFVTLRLKDALLQFSDRAKGLRLLTLKRRNTLPSHPLNIYHNAREISLSRFIDCLVDHRLKSLIKYGRATEYQLQAAWDVIYQDYCDLSGGSTYKVMDSLANDIAHLDRKHTHIRVCLRVLSERDSLVCANKLRQFGYKYDFSWSNPDQMRRDLDRVFTKSATIEVVLQQKIQQREQMLGKMPKGGEINRDWFNRVLVDLSKHQGYRLDAEVISVTEFCQVKQNYEKEIEYLNSKATATHGKG